MNRKRWTVLVLALLIWAGSLLGCRAIARSRVREQYRSYARQALSTEVLSCLHLTDAAIDEALASGELVSCAEIAQNFAVAAEMQRVLRNTYLRDEPGGYPAARGSKRSPVTVRRSRPPFSAPSARSARRRS